MTDFGVLIFHVAISDTYIVAVKTIFYEYCYYYVHPNNSKRLAR